MLQLYEKFKMKILQKKSKVLTRSRGYTAFTLAETLIVVGVIGVIAAMTIASLIRSSWASEQKNQFKKSYATVTNATEMIKTNVGYYPSYFYAPGGGSTSTSEFSLFLSEFKKNLNIAKECQNNAYSNGCIPYYNDNAQAGCGGLSQSNMLNNNTAYVLSDGTIIVLYPGMPLYVVDINGKRLPNKWGQDLFTLMWAGTSDFIKLQPIACYTPEGNGVNTSQMMQDAFK